MTPEDIIKKIEGYPDWQNIKITNPDEYQRLSQNAIICKFENVLPYYLKWQNKNGSFNRYIESMPCVTEVFNNLLGEETVTRLHKKLLIHVARSKTKHKIFNKIVRKYIKKISKYKQLLLQGQIVEDINFGDLNFNKNNVCFFKCRMRIYPYLNQSEIAYLKKNIDKVTS